MNHPTIHPFHKSSAPIPTEVLARICRIDHEADLKSTLANIASTCQRAYEIAIPLLYRSLELTTENAEHIFYGLSTWRPDEARRFEQYFSYNSEGLPRASPASRVRKLRALSHVETLRVDGIPPSKICKRLHILDMSSSDRDGTGQHYLLLNCRYLIFNAPHSSQPQLSGSLREPKETALFISAVPLLLNTRSTHLCLTGRSEWMIDTGSPPSESDDGEQTGDPDDTTQDFHLKDAFPYASVTCHGDTLLGGLNAPSVRFFLPARRSSELNRNDAMNSLRAQLEIMYDVDEQEGETMEPILTDRVEFIGAGPWFADTTKRDKRHGDDTVWDAEVAEILLCDQVKDFIEWQGWGRDVENAAKFTKAGAGEPCVCCGGR